MQAYEILQVARPDTVVLVEWVLVSHGFQAGDFFLLREDLVC